ncbi:glycosyl hydrolase [Falsihalocynthiibacter sp. S25ZX9]|uniref:glycosyl hydrolase n=1 Tax=Falsihalocynthiibacter sp. S25ZX9 TaxID=3240870 RepID=UPI00350EDA72
MKLSLFSFVAMVTGQINPLFAQDAVSSFALGTQTHFEQGWSIDLLDAAQVLGAVALRDEIGWDQVETEMGVYDFTIADQYMLPLINRGFKPLIVINEVNQLYDDGKTPHSPDGRAAFAAYVSAILSHYGADAVRIEIGNEVNTTDFVSGPALNDPARSFAALTRAVDARLQVDHPDAQFSCGGLNTIGIGFLQAFFRRGGLLACDAISVHPYRDHPETLPSELTRLKALMREFGGQKPIHVTEFGNWFDDPQDAPAYMIKMVAILSAADVRFAYWYALTDEKWWPNMGLLNEAGVEQKPAAAAFSFLQTRLLPLGRARRQGDDTAAYIYTFGPQGRGAVFWGSGGDITVTDASAFYNVEGVEIPPVTTLSDSPVIVLGDSISIIQSAPNRIADSQSQYGQSPWNYFARRPDIGLVPLGIIDSNWTSTRGAPDLSPLQIGDSWITTARFNDAPYSVVERFTAQRAGSYVIDGWWQASAKTDAPHLTILHNGRQVVEANITADRFKVSGMSIPLEIGDTLDFEVAPQEPSGTGALQRRIRITGP